jgi:hypothetical protein
MYQVLKCNIDRFSQGTPVSFPNKTDCHNITEILLKMALNRQYDRGFGHLTFAPKQAKKARFSDMKDERLKGHNLICFIFSSIYVPGPEYR